MNDPTKSAGGALLSAVESLIAAHPRIGVIFLVVALFGPNVVSGVRWMIEGPADLSAVQTALTNQGDAIKRHEERLAALERIASQNRELAMDNQKAGAEREEWLKRLSAIVTAHLDAPKDPP